VSSDRPISSKQRLQKSNNRLAGRGENRAGDFLRLGAYGLHAKPLEKFDEVAGMV
jgi:hypothetical protein